MSNTNLEDVVVQLTETRNELSEEDLRLWDGLENERVSRIAGDDANKSLTLQVQDTVSGTERRLSTEVIHREQGDLDKLGLLNQLSQSMSDYRIKTDKEIEAERFARDILGINLDARITTAEASFNHKELKLYQDIQEVFTNLDGKYSSMDARIKKYEEMLQDITMDSIKITMDNGEINMGAWTILSQAREWDLEILAKMRGFQEKTTEDVNQALEELQNQLPITENIINEMMENLSESPLIAELRDALNESIDTTDSLELKLAQEEAARAKAMIDLAYANAQALAAEKAALAESLAAEAQARADEVQAEADRRIESIRQIRADLEQDVGELNDQVDTIREGATADKASILETVNSYRTELKSDIATVNTELLGALDGVNTLVTEVRNENEVTLNELTTYKSSNDVAVAGLVSKISTNVSDTAANASKISGLTADLATTNAELGTVRNTSANALSKADTAVSANNALATRVDSLAAAITDLGEGAETLVDVYAFNALKAEVGTNAAGVSSLVEQVDALGANYTNLADGVQANTDAVSTLTVKQSEMNGDISQLSSDVTFLTSELGVTNTALNTKASNQALSNLNTKLTTTDGKVAANTQQLTQLNTDFTAVKNGLETKASTEALNNLATEVTELEGGLAVNASAITSLKGEIDTELNKKATVTAVNGLTTKVNEVDGKTTANANNILALNTSVGNVVNGLANKLDASTISDYYTKSQTDAKASEVAAGKVEEFSANLVIGGDNLFSLSGIKRYYGGSIADTSLFTVNGREIKCSNKGSSDHIGNAITLVDTTQPLLIRFTHVEGVNDNVLYYRCLASDGTTIQAQRTVTGTRVGKVVNIAVPATSIPEGTATINIGFGGSSAAITVTDVMVVNANVMPEWTSSSRDVQDALNANSTAIQNTNAEVSRVDGRVTATNSAQTLLEGRVKHVEGDITKKADASALSSLDTRVGSVEGKYTSQASDITSLSNSLDTTNLNVGTAQTAAQNAMNAAGSKGKVIFGNTAPAVEDRLVQNLWIDTTSNANTPKRWNGSAWVVVTDKVATDAANAVSALDTVVRTKADVSALNSLTTKVNDEAGKTTANTNSITTLNSDIVRINNDLSTKANASALNDIYTKQQVDDKALSTVAGEISKYDANLVIGGANLFSLLSLKSYAGGNLGNDVSYITVDGSTLNVVNQGTGSRIPGNLIPVDYTKDIIISWYPLGNYTTHQIYYATQDASGAVVTGQRSKTATKGADGRIVITIPKSELSPTVTHLRLGLGSTSNTTYSFKDVQVEQGSKVTAWAPSPRDTQAELNANATAIQSTNAEVIKVDGKTTVNANNISGLTSRMGTVEGKVATKAEASALQNYYTKTEAAENATTVAAGEVSKFKASLDTVNDSLRITGTKDFLDTVKTTSSTSQFSLVAEASSLTGQVLRIGTGSGNNQVSAALSSFILIDPLKMYRLKWRYRRVSGAGGVYIGAHCVNADKTKQVTLTNLEQGINVIGANDHYSHIDGKPAFGVWVEGEFYFKGKGATSSTGSGTLASPRTFANKAMYFSPMFIANYANQTGIVEVDYVIVEDAEAISETKSNASAIQSTNAEVARVDGRVTTESNRTTALTGRVDTVQNGLALKADVSALNNIYTKAESDAKATSLAAGEVSKYDSSLKVGGENLWSLDSAYSISEQGIATIEYVDRNKEHYKTTVTAFNTSNTNITRHDNMLLSKSLADVDKNSQYTLSFEIRAVKAGNLTVYGYFNNANTVTGISVSTEWQRFEFTPSAKPAGTGAGGTSQLLAFGLNTAGWAINDWYEVRHIQMQKGTKATAFSKATLALQKSLDANANAISTTNTEVSRINGVVSGHSTQLTELNASIAGKADSSALSALTVRVTEEEKKSSTQASDITSLTSTANDALNSVTIKDTRSTNQPPSWYLANYARRSVNEFKSQSAIGVSGFFGGTYCNLETKVYYSDLSGGHIIQTATSSADPSLYVQRVSTSTTAWGTWSQPIKDIRDTLGTKASASAVSTLDTKVDNVDGKVTTQASQILTLTSDNTANKNALQVQAKVIDGVQASYMVKMESNGVIGGFGMIQNTGNMGQVVTSFGVNADAFFIGAPASKKQPFIVTTSNQVVNGVTYPAGTYIDVALIANATIGTAHIADASITNAKIKELDASKITTGTLDAQRIRVGSSTQFDTGFAPTDVLNGAKSYTDTKTKTFTAQPTTPYASGDIYRNGASIYVCTTSRASGSYVASDWVLVGDVTANNTAANANQLGGKAAATVFNDITAAKNAADAANGQVVLWKYPNSTFIDGGKIYANSITANQISTAAIDTIALQARNGTFTAADGSKTVINGGLTQVFYPNGKVAVKLGVW